MSRPCLPLRNALALTPTFPYPCPCPRSSFASQVLPAANYSATLLPSASTVRLGEPLAWFANVSRSAALDPQDSAPLDLTCVLYPGEGNAPSPMDAAYLNPRLMRVAATMAPGASTATCAFPDVRYNTSGAKTASLQVFMSKGGSLGLLGPSKPLFSTPVIVPLPPSPPPSPTPSPPPAPPAPSSPPSLPEASPSPLAPPSNAPSTPPPAADPTSLLTARSLAAGPVVCAARTSTGDLVATQTDGFFQ